MRFNLIPYRAVGPITFSMTRQEVRNILPQAEILSTEHGEDPKFMSVRADYVGGLQVEYDRNDICCSIGITPPNEAILNDHSLLSLPYL